MHAGAFDDALEILAASRVDLHGHEAVSELDDRRIRSHRLQRATGLEAEQTTKSGLVIPDTAKEKPQEGKVLATGPGRIDDNGNRVPLDVSVDDVVIFSKYGGTEVKYDGQELLLLNARDILAVVTK